MPRQQTSVSKPHRSRPARACVGWGTSQRTARVRGRGVGFTPCAGALVSDATRRGRQATRVSARTASAGGAGGAGTFSFGSASGAGAGDALARAGVARLRALAGDLPAPALRGRSGVVRPARESRRQTPSSCRFAKRDAAPLRPPGARICAAAAPAGHALLGASGAVSNQASAPSSASPTGAPELKSCHRGAENSHLGSTATSAADAVAASIKAARAAGTAAQRRERTANGQ